jgi:hypothetical protein
MLPGNEAGRVGSMSSAASMSFHILHKKPEIRRITELEGHCRRLLQSLPDAIALTRQEAPYGEPGPHPLIRKPRHNLENSIGKWREAHWEEALWRKYAKDNSQRVPDLWARILSYQVMLRNTNTDTDWGEIYLFGVTDFGVPVAEEVKGENCKQSPLQMFLEGCAYAIALQKAWPVLLPKFRLPDL